MNKVILIGNLTKDPEMRSTGTGKSVCAFTLAISQGKDKTDFIDCVAWDKAAENIAKYMSKGKKMCVIGRLQKRSYDTDSGKRYVTEVIVNEYEFLSPMGQKHEPEYEPVSEEEAERLPF